MKNFEIKNGIIHQFLILSDHQWDKTSLFKVDLHKLSLELIESKNVNEGALEEDEDADDFESETKTSQLTFKNLNELQTHYENAIKELLRKGYLDRNANSNVETILIDFQKLNSKT